MVTNTSANTPTGTAGTVLQGQGAGVALELSTATYPATTTINQVLYSSAANTVAGLATANRAVMTTGATGVPVMTALATDGQVIIGSTAGAPAAATLTAGSGISITNASNAITIASSGSPLPNVLTNAYLYEDFILTPGLTLAGGSPSFDSTYSWSSNSTACFWGIANEAAHPGMINMIVPLLVGGGGGSPATTSIFVETLNGVVLGAGVFDISWTMKIITLSSAGDTYLVRIGMLSNIFSVTATSTKDGIYFEYTHSVNSGNWVNTCSNANTSSTSNTSTAADTNWHTYKISVNAAANSVTFYIDGVAVGSAVTTNIPTGPIGPSIQFYRTTGKANILPNYIDLMVLNYALTSSR